MQFWDTQGNFTVRHTEPFIINILLSCKSGLLCTESTSVKESKQLAVVNVGQVSMGGAASTTSQLDEPQRLKGTRTHARTSLLLKMQ